MKKVLLINGLKRSGKDYTTELISEILGDENTESISFAGPIKQIISDTFEISLRDLEEYKNDTENYGLEIKAYPNNQESVTIKHLDFRTILQRFGTEAMKPVFGDSVWAELAIRNVIKSNKEWVLIPDFRFVSEFEEAVKEAASNNFEIITINIFNDDLPQPDAHASETELKDKEFKFDFIIDNTGQPDIEGRVKNILDDITS